jgi:hypothetical protein
LEGKDDLRLLGGADHRMDEPTLRLHEPAPLSLGFVPIVSTRRLMAGECGDGLAKGKNFGGICNQKEIETLLKEKITLSHCFLKVKKFSLVSSANNRIEIRARLAPVTLSFRRRSAEIQSRIADRRRP